jgi:hypothetical protein
MNMQKTSLKLLEGVLKECREELMTEFLQLGVSIHKSDKKRMNGVRDDFVTVYIDTQIELYKGFANHHKLLFVGAHAFEPIINMLWATGLYPSSFTALSGRAQLSFSPVQNHKTGEFNFQHWSPFVVHFNSWNEELRAWMKVLSPKGEKNPMIRYDADGMPLFRMRGWNRPIHKIDAELLLTEKYFNALMPQVVWRLNYSDIFEIRNVKVQENQNEA